MSWQPFKAHRLTRYRAFLGMCTTLVTAATLAAVPGGIAHIDLHGPATEVLYGDRAVLVYDHHALVGIPIAGKPGEHSITITRPDGSKEIQRFDVAAKTYPEQRITLKNKKMVNPDPVDLDRIRAEARSMRSVYSSFSGHHPDLTDFVQPVQGIVTSEFGFRRILNGEPRNPHSGLDIAAVTGTPIANPTAGVVALTGNFYFNGNTVLVDHGMGLVTMVCHLSKIAVEQLASVAAGDILGEVGATGRATGPHLHWSMSLNGHRVDPVALLSLFGSDQAEAEPAPSLTPSPTPFPSK